jgi:phage I-like protein
MRGIDRLGASFALLHEFDSTAVETGRRWIQLAKAGDWHNARHGAVPITTDDLRTMHANFSTGLYPPPGVKPPIDYEHLSTKQDRKPGDGEAAGWIEETQLRSEDTELWGLVDWVEEAKERIKSKKYRYFSPTFHRNWIAHGGKAIGPVLFGGALTNYPTMPLSPVTCDVLHELANAEDLPLSDRERRVTDALNARFPPTMGRDGMSIDWSSQVWARYTYDDRVVYSRGGKDFEIKYAFKDDLSVAFEGDPYEVIVSSTPVLSLSSEVDSMKVKNAQGVEIELASLSALTLDQLAELPAVKALREKADKAPGPTEMSQLRTDLDTLSQTVNTLNATNTKQAADLLALSNENAELKKERTAQRIDKAIAAGKILPVEKEEFVSLSQEAPTVFEKLIAKREAGNPLVAMNVSHGVTGLAQSGSIEGTPSAAAEFDRVCREYAKTHSVSYAEAVREMGRERKELAQAAKDSETVIAFTSQP